MLCIFHWMLSTTPDKNYGTGYLFALVMGSVRFWSGWVWVRFKPGLSWVLVGFELGSSWVLVKFELGLGQVSDE